MEMEVHVWVDMIHLTNKIIDVDKFVIDSALYAYQQESIIFCKISITLNLIAKVSLKLSYKYTVLLY